MSFSERPWAGSREGPSQEDSRCSGLFRRRRSSAMLELKRLSQISPLTETLLLSSRAYDAMETPLSCGT